MKLKDKTLAEQEEEEEEEEEDWSLDDTSYLKPNKQSQEHEPVPSGTITLLAGDIKPSRHTQSQ